MCHNSRLKPEVVRALENGLMRSSGHAPKSAYLVAIGMLLALHNSGCQQEQLADHVQVEAASGALGIQLNCGGLEIDSVNYSIQKAGLPYRAGTFDVAGPGTNFSAVIALLDPADDYTIALDAMATNTSQIRAASAPCSGSGAFGIQIGETTAVAVTLHCPVEQDDGNLVHERQCPGVDAVRALPAEAPIGKCVFLEAVADAIAAKARSATYHWLASSGGALQDVVGPHANFLCTALGLATISVELHDDDDPLCSQRFPLYVACRGAGNPHSALAAAAGGSASAPHK
jgi:hypothetical protein